MMGKGLIKKNNNLKKLIDQYEKVRTFLEVVRVMFRSPSLTSSGICVSFYAEGQGRESQCLEIVQEKLSRLF